VDDTTIAPKRVRTFRDVLQFVRMLSPKCFVLDSLGGLEHAAPDDLDLLREAIGEGCAFVIAHVNKAGDMAGAEKFQHKADAVVWIRKTTLYTAKNWYGPQGIRTKRILPSFTG
jgi:hypothetical protein